MHVLRGSNQDTHGGPPCVTPLLTTPPSGRTVARLQLSTNHPHFAHSYIQQEYPQAQAQATQYGGPQRGQTCAGRQCRLPSSGLDRSARHGAIRRYGCHGPRCARLYWYHVMVPVPCCTRPGLTRWQAPAAATCCCSPVDWAQGHRHCLQQVATDSCNHCRDGEVHALRTTACRVSGGQMAGGGPPSACRGPGTCSAAAARCAASGHCSQ